MDQWFVPLAEPVRPKYNNGRFILYTASRISKLRRPKAILFDPMQLTKVEPTTNKEELVSPTVETLAPVDQAPLYESEQGGNISPNPEPDTYVPLAETSYPTGQSDLFEPKLLTETEDINEDG